MSLFLTMPSDEGQSTRQVQGAFLKRLAKEYFGLPRATYPKDLFELLPTVVQLLKGLGKSGLFNLLRRPELQVYLSCAVNAVVERDGPWARKMSGALLFQTLYELALDGKLPADGVVWPKAAPIPEVCSPLRRVHTTFPDGHAGLTFRPGEIVVHGGDADGDVLALRSGSSEKFVPVADHAVLALADTNPISDFEAHPDKEGNQLSLGASTAADWAESISKSLDVVERHVPGIRREMSAVVQQFVPVGTDDEKHLSASYKESVGTIYLTLHPQLMTMVEAIIHEFQHNKINMLFRLDPILHNAFFPLFASPVRPDPRPLWGVLLAAHAFVPVAEMYRRIEGSDDPLKHWGGFKDRFRAIVQKNSDALDVLNENARATEKGQAVLNELNALNTSHREYLGLD